MQQGVFWNVAAALFSQGSSFAVTFLLAKWFLSTAAFGEYGFLLKVLVPFSSLVQLALGITTTKYLAEHRSVDKPRAGRLLGLCTVLSAALAALAAIIALGAAYPASWALRGSGELAPGFMLAAGALAFAALNAYQIGALAGLESYGAIARCSLVAGLANVAVSVVAAWAFGVRGAAAALTLAWALRWVLFRISLRKQAARHGIRVSYQGIWRERHAIYRLSLPGLACGLTNMPAELLSAGLLMLQPAGKVQMALFTVANKIHVLVRLMPSLMNSVGISMLNNQRGLGDPRRYRLVFWAHLAATAAVAIVAAGVFVAVGPWLLAAFREDYVRAYPVLQLLMLMAVAHALSMPLFAVIQSRERMWQVFLFNALPRDVATVAVAAWLVPRYGAVGLAAGLLTGYTLALAANIVLAMRLGLGLGDRAAPASGAASAGADPEPPPPPNPETT